MIRTLLLRAVAGLGLIGAALLAPAAATAETLVV
jgi:hypothetical protein